MFKSLHFIAIGGSIMHQLAIAMHRQGVVVSGSDDSIFDPARTNLFNEGLLPDEIGWFPDKITPQTDAVILGMHARKDNPELLKAQALGIPVLSYPEFIYQHAAAKTRVVIAGSHGKTTITAMVMHALQYWGYSFDYVVGAAVKGFNQSVGLSKDAPILVIEGDEYLASAVHPKPKFLFYQPYIALISGIAWDHINVFPTFELYVKQFELFIQTIQPNGSLIYCAADALLHRLAQAQVNAPMNLLPYNTPEYKIDNQVWQVQQQGNTYPLQIFGEHNLQNMMGAQLVCQQLGITPAQFMEAIQQFTGAARRLELLAQSTNTAVYKDFAHAPSKALATTNALKQMNPNRKLIACLELHTYSSLNAQFLSQYANTLNAANEALVFYDPQALAIKQLPPVSEQDIQQCFNHPNLRVFTQPNLLQDYLYSRSYHQTNLLLMSSGNFGGINLPALANFAIS